MGIAMDFIATYVGLNAPYLRQACAADAIQKCNYDSKNVNSTKGQEAVLSCLLANVDATTPQCKDVLRMSVGGVYRFSQKNKSAISQICSKDVQQQCKGRVGIEKFVCMRNMTRQTTSADCQKLIDFLNAGPLVVYPRPQQARQAPRSSSGIVLSGPIAIASVASLVVVCLAAGVYFYRKYTGKSVYRPYTIIKSGDV